MEDRQHELQSCFGHIITPMLHVIVKWFQTKSASQKYLARKIWPPHIVFSEGADSQSKYLHCSSYVGKPTFVSIWNVKANLFGARGKQSNSNASASVQKQASHQQSSRVLRCLSTCGAGMYMST